MSSGSTASCTLKYSGPFFPWLERVINVLTQTRVRIVTIVQWMLPSAPANLDRFTKVLVFTIKSAPNWSSTAVRSAFQLSLTWGRNSWTSLSGTRVHSFALIWGFQSQMSFSATPNALTSTHYSSYLVRESCWHALVLMIMPDAPKPSFTPLSTPVQLVKLTPVDLS